MNMLESLMSAQGGGAVRELGAKFGLDEQQTTSALSALLPALAAGFQRNLQSEGGVASLMAALQSGGHQRYLDDPSNLNDQNAVADGNGILGHVFGSKEVSREVANRASAQSGLSPDILKQMLPLVATMMMGAFARQSAGSAMAAGAGAQGGGLAQMLGPLLDRNRDGSIVDDVTGMIGRFMNRS